MDERRTWATGLSAYVERIQHLPEWAPLLEDTKRRRQFCQEQWERTLPASLSTMRSLTGLDFRRCFRVTVTYPGLPGGRTLDQTGPAECPNAIAWGGREEFPAYTVVYIWHEILHSYFEQTDRDHAIIELVTDNELRVRLNGGTYPPFEGHPYLGRWKAAVEPAWRAYLGQGHRDIRQFAKLTRGYAPARGPTD